MISNLGRSTIDFCEEVGRLFLFLLQVVRRMLVFPLRYQAVLRQFYFIGSKSVLVVFLSSLTIGLVLGLQMYHTLSLYGAVDQLGTIVAKAMIREMGPVVTALMIVGRAGSAMCAEIGIMRSDEQLDALECMAIDPYKFLMVPKFWATIVSLPLLVALSDVIGIFGGYIAGVIIFDVPAGGYWQSLFISINWTDLNMSLVKSLVFGLIIVWIATGKGYYLHLDKQGSYGAEGVSRMTTQAVVLSFVLILFANYLITAFMV